MRDPIWALLADQGRNMKWLARVTGYRHSYVRRIACGASKPSGAFRRACVRALETPESALFFAENYDDSESLTTVVVV